jgi:uncharacterized phiE125 gp8 family phage protein
MINWTTYRTIGPVNLPVTISVAKVHLRLVQEDSYHDDWILRALQAATEQLERDTDRVWISATYVHTLDRAPTGNQVVTLELQPITGIETVTYVDPDGATQTLDPADYVLDASRRFIYPAPGKSWPTAMQVRNAMSVTFLAGYGSEPGKVPALAQQAILLQVGRWFSDPKMEAGAVFTTDAAYERIVSRLLRTSYP